MKLSGIYRNIIEYRPLFKTKFLIANTLIHPHYKPKMYAQTFTVNKKHAAVLAAKNLIQFSRGDSKVLIPNKTTTLSSYFLGAVI